MIELADLQNTQGSETPEDEGTKPDSSTRADDTELVQHKASVLTHTHAADSITYDGSIMGASDIKQAVEIVKTTLDQAMISGDSGLEAMAARVDSINDVTYDSLKDRLDSMEQRVGAFSNFVIDVTKPPIPLVPAVPGQANSTAPMQACLDYVSARGGGTVFVPEGTYNIVQLRPKSNTLLLGAGLGVTKLFCIGKDAAAASLYPASNAARIALRGFTVDGNKTGRGFTVTINTSAHTISFAYGSDLEVSGVEVLNSAGASIAFFNCDRVTVRDSVIRSSGNNGILGTQSCRTFRIQNNKIYGTDFQNGIFFLYQERTIGSGNVTTGSNQITNVTNIANWRIGDVIKGAGIPLRATVTGLSGTTLTISANATGTYSASLKTEGSAYDVIISGNYVENAADFGIEVGDHVAEGYIGHQYITVENNLVVNSKNAGIAYRTVSYSSIVNNRIIGWGVNGGYGCDGIFVEGENNFATDVRIKDNTLRQTNVNATAPVNGGNGIYVTGMTDVWIRENKVYSPQGNGICIQAASMQAPTADFPLGYREVYQCKVVDNTITGGSKHGVFVQCYSQGYIKVNENFIRGCALNGIYVTNYQICRMFRVCGNDVSKCGGNGLTVYNMADSIVNDQILLSNCQSSTQAYGDQAAAIQATGCDYVQFNFNYNHDPDPVPKQTLRMSSHDNGNVFWAFNVSRNSNLSAKYSQSTFREIRYPLDDTNYFPLSNALTTSLTALINSGTTANRDLFPTPMQLYFDTDMGKLLVCSRVGTREIDTINITAGAAADGNVAVTLNGVAVNVPVAANDSADAVASKIRAATFAGWTTTGSGSGTGTTVTFKAVNNLPRIPPSFDGNGTGVTGDIFVATAGANNTWVDGTGVTVWQPKDYKKMGDLINTDNNRYQCTAAGITGTTMPTHTSGTAPDGTVTWQWVKSIK